MSATRRYGEGRCAECGERRFTTALGGEICLNPHEDVRARGERR